MKRGPALPADEEADEPAPERRKGRRNAGDDGDPRHEGEAGDRDVAENGDEQEQEGDQRPGAEAVAADSGTDA